MNADASASPILAFSGEHRFLSNFWVDGPLKVELGDLLPWSDEQDTAHHGLPGVLHGSLIGLSVEHIYQAAKVGPEQDGLLADDRVEKMHAILTAKTPAAAKQIGRHVQPLVLGWEQGLKQRVMLACLRAKFAPGSEMAGDLLATGYRMLVEGNTWGDRVWGATWADASGRDLERARERGTKVWARREGRDGDVPTFLAGENWLGRLLMLVRAELDCEVSP